MLLRKGLAFLSGGVARAQRRRLVRVELERLTTKHDWLIATGQV
jgi:hypothetical protein